MVAAHVAAALDQREGNLFIHSAFAFALAGMFVFVFAADVGFVDFDGLAFSAERAGF